MVTIADKVIEFNKGLRYQWRLPEGVEVLNPFTDNPEAMNVSTQFYQKYYDDQKPRKLILGINPGRFGAGATGIPFTDPKRLTEVCKIPYAGPLLHEPSSVFVYEVIEAFGGADAFFSAVYIHSVFPLGFTKVDERGKAKNYNYYDNKELLDAVLPFIIWNIDEQKRISNSNDVCYCLGTGANYRFLTKLNSAQHFFKEIIPLEHPRFVVQYKQKEKKRYIDQYLKVLKG